MPTVAPETPLCAGLDDLFRRHEAAMHADTPPGSIHMLPRAALAGAGLTFFVMREGGLPVGMVALKRIGPADGEVKSMHVLSERRGRGLSRLLLDAVIAEARALGLSRLWLETGAQPSFAAARRLYATAGFAECPPFASYRPDPNSVFMSRTL